MSQQQADAVNPAAADPAPAHVPASPPSPPAGVTPPPAGASPPAPAPDPYDLGDTGYDPDIDEFPDTPGAAAPAAATAPPEGDGRPAAGAAAAPPPASPHTHSQRLTRLARDFGIPQAEIDATPPAELEAEVYRLTRRLMDDHSRRAHDAPAAPTATPAPPDDEPDLSEEEGFDPKLVKAIRRQAAEVKELKAKLAAREQAEARTEAGRATDEADAFFASHEATYGPGRAHECDSAADTFGRRLAVLGEAGRDAAAGTLRQKIERAHRRLFGAPPPPAPKPAAAPEADRALERAYLGEAALARPTHRDPREPKGERRAMASVRDKLREKNFSLDGYDGNEEDGLLD